MVGDLISFPLIALLGACVGSVVNVLLWRIPIMLAQPHNRDFNLCLPRSHCPLCKTPIAWHYNVPVLGWLFLKGRTACCQQPLARRYVLIELLLAILALLLSFLLASPVLLAAGVLFSALLVALLLTDLQHMLLPDVLTQPLLWSGLLLALSGAGPISLESALLGAVTGYLALWLLYWVVLLACNKEGMGYGDFKLMAALGAWCGWKMLPSILLLAALLTLAFMLAARAVHRRSLHEAIPFGPGLALSGWVGWLLAVHLPFIW